MMSIGGYFELELRTGNEYHAAAIRLNSGRNALEYILSAKNYRKIYLPFYTCEAVLEPVLKLNVSYEFYHIDEKFEALFPVDHLEEGEVFLYTNYFGLKDEYIYHLNSKCPHLIIDNAQAFYSKPLKGIDTFYSPRKFFGVPDGGYLYTDKPSETNFEQAISFKRFEHLIRRIDISAEDGYPIFSQNEASLKDLPILAMSTLTSKLLCNIDYDYIASKRRSNYIYLEERLRESNRLTLQLNIHAVPLTYPFYSRDPGLRQRLIENRIYSPTFWENVEKWSGKQSLESDYARNIIHLPVDQRWGEKELDQILNVITK